jgi:hypothetical protein
LCICEKSLKQYNNNKTLRYFLNSALFSGFEIDADSAQFSGFEIDACSAWFYNFEIDSTIMKPYIIESTV